MIPMYEPYILPEYAEAVKNQILSGWIGSGKKVIEFEEKFAEYVGTRNAIAVTSGTAALFVTLLAIKPGYRGNRVILPNYSFIAATNVIYSLDYFVFFRDISENTLCLDLNTVSDFDLTGKDALIFINHNGYVGKEVGTFAYRCKQNNMFMIEDSACALGQRYNGKHAGTIADIGCFSFSTPKILSTGQGGMIVTDNDDIAVRCREIVDQGSTTWRKDGIHIHDGLNFKFNDILAAYGLAQLRIIDDLLYKRYVNQERYIKNGVKLITYLTQQSTGTWMNILRCKNAHNLMWHLKSNGIESRMMYKPCDVAKGLGPDMNLSMSYKLYEQLLYLPSSLTLTNDQIDYISEKILGYEK